MRDTQAWVHFIRCLCARMMTFGLQAFPRGAALLSH